MSLGNSNKLLKKTHNFENGTSLSQTGQQISLQNNKIYILNMPSHLIESRPEKVKIVHKYLRTLILLFQPITNQITLLSFTLEPYYDY